MGNLRELKSARKKRRILITEIIQDNFPWLISTAWILILLTMIWGANAKAAFSDSVRVTNPISQPVPVRIVDPIPLDVSATVVFPDFFYVVASGPTTVNQGSFPWFTYDASATAVLQDIRSFASQIYSNTFDLPTTQASHTLLLTQIAANTSGSATAFNQQAANAFLQQILGNSLQLQNISSQSTITANQAVISSNYLANISSGTDYLSFITTSVEGHIENIDTLMYDPTFGLGAIASNTAYIATQVRATVQDLDNIYIESKNITINTQTTASQTTLAASNTLSIYNKLVSGVPVLQSTSPWITSGTTTVFQGTSPWIISGTVTTSINFPASLTVNQGTSPWVTSATGITPVSGIVSIQNPVSVSNGAFTRIMTRQFLDTEFVKYDIPALPVSGTFIYQGVAPIGTATSSAVWSVVRTPIVSGDVPSESRIRFNISWDGRASGW